MHVASSLHRRKAPASARTRIC